LQYHPERLRGAQRLVLTAAASVLTAFGLSTLTAKVALAEFEIQEAGVEKGEKECEYRGAVHWGFPKKEREEAEEEEDDEAADDDDDAAEEEVGALEEEEEGEFVRQSHDVECEYGVTNRIKVGATLSADEPLHEDFDLSSVSPALLYALIKREGNGFALSFQTEYGFATRGHEADELEFGPIMEIASGGFLLTTNTFFTSQVGEHRETDSLGFDYGWRAQQRVAKKWAVGVEMFGEIEDLSNAGSFNDQTHSIGPTLFYMPGGSDDDDDNGNGGDDNDDKRLAGPAEMEFSLNVGVQFGLTDVTSDTALKFQGSLAF
jgi:hypothetical protein